MTRAESGLLVLLAALCGAYVLSALIVGAMDSPEVTSVGPGVLLTVVVAGLLSRDHEFHSIGSTRRRTLQSHPD